MNRPTISALLLAAFGTACLASSAAEPAKATSAPRPPKGVKAVIKTEAEWKKLLSSEEYRILRQDGTERAFTGEFWNHKEQGTYTCGACNFPLYTSSDKFRSGTGWPSFTRPIKDGHVTSEVDRKWGMVRTEITCARCGSHLGHVFNDGPAPTGKRHCVNSASLNFVSEGPSKKKGPSSGPSSKPK